MIGSYNGAAGGLRYIFQVDNGTVYEVRKIGDIRGNEAFCFGMVSSRLFMKTSN
jgi:hypothetical protein